MCHISKGSITYLNVMIMPCIPATRQQHILCFLCVYFQINVLTSTSQQIYIVSTDQHLVILDRPNGLLEIKLKSNGVKASPYLRSF
jgi:hypothetical protein